MTKKIKYSEIFHSFQGEGFYTGYQTAWIRFFLCNLQCDGFGQKDPTDPSTYVLPYKDFDISTVDRVEDLPVWEYGCDSSYTWAKKFGHLAHEDTVEEVCDKFQAVFAHESNPDGLFHHPKTGQDTHLAFTGGEPMINQKAMIYILQEFERRNNYPAYITVETNGTKPFKDIKFQGIERTMNFGDLVDNHVYFEGCEWFWSCSPKLWTTAGEKPQKAIKPEVVGSYAEVSHCGQLKYVVNGTQESWDEVERNTELFRQAGVDWDVWIMGVGATKEEQETNQMADIAMEANKLQGRRIIPLSSYLVAKYVTV